jgi:hypothetical protein
VYCLCLSSLKELPAILKVATTTALLLSINTAAPTAAKQKARFGKKRIHAKGI